ncbi:MAG TPA: helix-turn-helix transcriptional regulator, partial [Chryseolinea sp.]
QQSVIFSGNLKKQMREKEITQADLAKRLNVTQGAVSNYVRGRVPMVWMVKEIAQTLGVTANDLLGEHALNERQQQEQELFAAIAEKNSGIGRMKDELVTMARRCRVSAIESEERARDVHLLADKTEVEALKLDMQHLNYGKNEIALAVEKLRKCQKQRIWQDGKEFDPEDYMP